MIEQKWNIEIDGEEHTVIYKCSILTGKTTLTVDGDSFTVKGKPFGIGIERREPIIIGGAQAMLDVKKNGRAVMFCREGDVKEL